MSTEPSEARTSNSKSPAPESHTQPNDGSKGYEIVYTCLLVDNVDITFSTKRERVRKNSNRLPDSFFRTAFEYSATLSAYVGKENHRKHKQKPHLKFNDQNAYQNFEDFFLTRDLNKYRIERQLVWNKTVDPSPYVSVVSNLTAAKKIAKDRYYKKSPPSDRVHITQISTQGLVPATIRGRLQTTQNTYMNKDELIPIKPATITYREVRIPVWIRSTAVPRDGSKITAEQWKNSGADMWVSVSELSQSKLNVQASSQHDTEWLCCGPVLMKHVIQVMPYDGDSEHPDDGTHPVVRSKRNLGWIWDWNLQRWVQDASLLPAPKATSDKRKRSNVEDDHNNTEPNQPQKRRVEDDGPDRSTLYFVEDVI